MLHDAGFVVVGEAADGAEALVAAAELEPDIVLLDIMLPDISGLDVAEQLAGSASDVAVVLTSSRSAADFGAALDASSARGFVAKGELTGAALRAAAGGR